MKKSSSELKSMAKGILVGHYALPMGAFVLIEIVMFIIYLALGFAFPPYSFISEAFYFICSLIIGLLAAIFTTGLNKLILNLSRGEEVHLGNLLYGFSHQPDRIILLSVLLYLICFACMLPGALVFAIGCAADFLLLAVIGIFLLIGGVVLLFIAVLNYSQIYYIYLDAPEKGVFEIMRESRELMKGNCGRLFYLYISFFGLILLSVFTCYIGLLWLVPYISTTTALFYRNLRREI